MRKIINAFIILLLLGNISFSVYLYLQFQALKSQKQTQPTSYSISSIPAPTAIPNAAPAPQSVDLSDYATKSYVDSVVASASPKTVVTNTQTTTKEPSVTYIPISKNYTTQSLDWVDVPDTDFYLDLVNDYGENATAYWEAFLHEEHGNGDAQVRLMDVTHGIVVANSELSTNNASSTLITSANLAIWRGKNLYRVQMKSQKGFVVYFDTGRLKITN